MSLHSELSAVVGAQHVLQGGDLSAYEVDWRKRYQGHAYAVVRPGNTLEVSAVIKACVTHGAGVVAQGGNTGLVGASVPDASGTQVLLNLGRLNRIRAIDRTNLTITADAGCVLQTLQEAAAGQGLLLALSLAAEGSCTIGGNLATNAGGTQVLRYGNAREQCLGLEVVTAQGEIWNGLSGLRKDNTGYDLRDLFIGSEGTLGVITAATLKLLPRPAARLTALASLTSLEAAIALLQLAQARLGPGLTGFEAMNEFSLGLVRKHFAPLGQPLGAAPWTVLLEQSDSESEAHAAGLFEGLLESALAQGLITDAAIASSLAQSKTMWHLRESIPLAQAQEGTNIKHDISLPISRIADFVAATDAQLQRACPSSKLVNFGHLGDGNLHYNLQAPQGIAPADFLREHEAGVNTIVYDAVTLRGGSISAEHGIGALKRDELVKRKSGVALAMMRSIKAALDPNNLMNPGRLL